MRKHDQSSAAESARGAIGAAAEPVDTTGIRSALTSGLR